MTGRELERLRDVLDRQYVNDGPLAREFERRVAALVGTRHAVAVTSGTAAITLALMAAGIGPGDEVLVPDLTFAATAHAEVEAGSRNVPAVSGQPMGKVAVRRGVQGPGGLFTARVLLLVNASKDNFGKPTSLAPDLYYSVSDTVQIGLLHTGPMGWQSLPGVGLCLTGTANRCPDTSVSA